MQVEALTSIGRTMEVVGNYAKSKPTSPIEVSSGYSAQRADNRLNFDRQVRNLPMPKLEKDPAELLSLPAAVRAVNDYKYSTASVSLQESSNIGRNFNSYTQWSRDFVVSLYQSMQNFGKRVGGKVNLTV